MYVNIILGDYVRTILNMNYAPDSTWALDPRESFSDDFAPGTFPLGVGNQCSVEFNLIYRWHSTVSARDEKWSEEFFEKVFPGRDVSKLPLREFLAGLATWREELMEQKPEDRTFGDLKRDKDGHFDSAELAKIIAESTNDCSGKISRALILRASIEANWAHSRFRGSPDPSCAETRHGPGHASGSRLARWDTERASQVHATYPAQKLPRHQFRSRRAGSSGVSVQGS